jgi:hypothetical protein
MDTLLFPPAIPEEWLDEGERYELTPTEEQTTPLNPELDLRWIVHHLTAEQLAELGLDLAHSWVIRWAAEPDGVPQRAILCASASIDDAIEDALAYLRTIVEGWIADEPARLERRKQRAGEWLKTYGWLFPQTEIDTEADFSAL